MLLYLLLLAFLSLVFLIIIFTNYRRTLKTGRPENLAFVRVFMAWILLITFIGSCGGAAYAATHQTDTKTEQSDKAVKPKKAKTTTSKLDELSLTFSPKSPDLNDGNVTVKFKLSQNTKLTIKRHKSGKTVNTYQSVKTKKSQSYTFNFDKKGKYDVIASRDGKTIKKTLTVKDPSSNSSSAASDSSSVDYGSQSSDVTSASSSSQSAGTGSTGSTYSGGTGSTYSGGTGSTYSGNSGYSNNYTYSGGSTGTSSSDSGSGSSDSNAGVASSEESAPADQTYGEGGQ